MPIAVITGSLLHNYHQSQNRVHLGKQLECQLANKDDLKSKSVLKKLFLEWLFYIRIDYRRNYLKHISCLLRNNRFQKRSVYMSKLAVPVS